jgi:hypothetical protein
MVSNSIQVVALSGSAMEDGLHAVAGLEPEGDAVSLLTFVPSPASLTAAGVGDMAAGHSS